MKKIYIPADISVIIFSNDDIITTSTLYDSANGEADVAFDEFFN